MSIEERFETANRIEELEAMLKKKMDLIKHLRELIEMWGEVAHMGNIDGSMKRESGARYDCMNNLEDILNGDYSCIERVDK
jgi:hypothetical protein